MYLTIVRGVPSDPYTNHKIVKSMCSGKVLFKESYGTLRVLTSERPEAPYKGEIVSTKEVFLPKEGDVLTMTLLFNPTKNKRVEGGKSIKEGIGCPELAKKWLTTKLKGVEILSMSVEPIPLTKVKSTVIQHLSLVALEVKDAGVFGEIIRTGLGGNKYAGWGMLDVWK